MTLSLEDRTDITELLSRYGLFLDQLRADEWLQLFLPDAVVEIEGMSSLRTNAERLELLHTAPRGVHLSAPPIISEGVTADTATSQQTFMFLQAKRGSLLAGWYDDALVKSEGTWRFQRRIIRFYREGPASA